MNSRVFSGDVNSLIGTACFISSEDMDFIRASSNVLPIPMASPIDFISIPISLFTENLSKGHLGIFTVM